jgi:hypothetical protein
LYGAVDDISVYQGAMTDAQVNAIYAAEAAEVSSS